MTAPPGFGPVQTPPPGFGPIMQAPRKASRAIDFSLGREVKFASAHPFTAMMNVLGTGQRGVEAAETGQDVWRAITHPQEAEELHQAVRAPMTSADYGRGLLTPLRAIGAGVGALERGPLAGSATWQKLGRGAADLPYDVVNDPLSLIPVGDAAKATEWLGRGLKAMNPDMVASAGKALESVGNWLNTSVVGKWLDPEYFIRGLSPAEQNAVIAATRGNTVSRDAALERGWNQIKANHAAIRGGEIPDEVRALFKDPEKYLDPIAKSKNPFLVRRAFADDLDVQQRADALQNVKLFAQGHDIDPTGMEEAVRNMMGHDLSKNAILQIGRYLTERGNQAFLAIPFAHGGNLTALSYLRYGIANTLKGLGYAAQIATGKMSKNVADGLSLLNQYGRGSRWNAVFSEMPPQTIFGIPGTGGLAQTVGRATVPMERFSNALQRNFLNPLDEGLRIAGLEAERHAGNDLDTAMRNLDSAFGTDPQTGLVRGATEIGEGFAKFHLQTSPNAGLRALANRPDRVAAMMKTQQDFNRQLNPYGPQYRGTVPGLAVARQVMDPLGYYSSVTGPLGELMSPSSPMSAFRQGKVAEALTQVFGRYVPANQVGPILSELAQGGPKQQEAVKDFLTLFTGGYYKPKALPP